MPAMALPTRSSDDWNTSQVFPGAAHTHEAQQPTNITSEIAIKPSAGAGAKLRAELKAKA